MSKSKSKQKHFIFVCFNDNTIFKQGWAVHRGDLNTGHYKSGFSSGIQMLILWDHFIHIMPYTWLRHNSYAPMNIEKTVSPANWDMAV